MFALSGLRIGCVALTLFTCPDNTDAGSSFHTVFLRIQTLPEAKNDDELMDIVKECRHIAVRAGAPSALAYIKVTYKPEGDVLTIEKKVTET